MLIRHALTRRQAVVAALAVGTVGRRAFAETPDSWASLTAQLFGDRPIADGTAVLAVDAPYRAEDAAMVPISIRMLGSADSAPQIKTLTLVIDETPSPLAATFSLGPNSGVRAISTRVRVDSYTNVHVVATA